MEKQHPANDQELEAWIKAHVAKCPEQEHRAIKVVSHAGLPVTLFAGIDDNTFEITGPQGYRKRRITCRGCGAFRELIESEDELLKARMARLAKRH